MYCNLTGTGQGMTCIIALFTGFGYNDVKVIVPFDPQHHNVQEHENF